MERENDTLSKTTRHSAVGSGAFACSRSIAAQMIRHEIAAPN
jgi:hypothetical protein